MASLIYASFSFAQDDKKIDSLLKVLAATKNDTATVWAMHDVAFNYFTPIPTAAHGMHSRPRLYQKK